MEEKGAKKKKGRPTTSLLDDTRFSAMFENPEFEINKDADEYKMLTPVLSRLDKSKLKELKRQQALKDVMDEEDEDAKSSDDDLFSERDGSSDDEDERQWSKEVKKQYKQIKRKNAMADKEEPEATDEIEVEPKMVAVPTNEFKVKTMRNKNNK